MYRSDYLNREGSRLERELSEERSERERERPEGGAVAEARIARAVTGRTK